MLLLWVAILPPLSGCGKREGPDPGKARYLTKRHPGTLSVDRVDLAASAGEVHAMVGENGEIEVFTSLISGLDLVAPLSS